SVIETYQRERPSVTAHPVGTFAGSWASTWKIFDKNTTSDTSNIDNTTMSQPLSSLTHGGLSSGATAGVVVSSVLGALGMVVAAALLWRKRNMMSKRTITDKMNEPIVAPLNDQSTGADGYTAELAHWQEPPRCMATRRHTRW
ncbi:MAG: hypothetical protein Q9226_007861, partial [Calogaya cf. arnoldii]